MEILHQDDRVIVCVKPAGVLSTDEPGGMPERIREALGGENAAVRSVHRLDRAVGGVMVYARTRRAAADLSRQIAEGTFEKRYLAVVRGAPEAKEGVMRDWLHRDKTLRKSFVVPEGSDAAQEAILDYQLLDTRAGMSLLSIRLHTGRTHQIRCQLSSRGYPLAGDRKYGAPEAECPPALWSYKIGFMHPRSGQVMEFMIEPENIYPWDRFFPRIKRNNIHSGSNRQ